MAFAISVGKPIRHNSFSKGEFVRYEGKELVDEEGTILPQQEFWAEYMVTSIVIKKADEMAKVLSDKFNQYGYDGWELVQYNLIPPSALVTASTIPCCGSIYILATFKKRLEK